MTGTPAIAEGLVSIGLALLPILGPVPWHAPLSAAPTSVAIKLGEFSSVFRAALTTLQSKSKLYTIVPFGAPLVAALQMNDDTINQLFFVLRQTCTPHDGREWLTKQHDEIHRVSTQALDAFTPVMTTFS